MKKISLLVLWVCCAYSLTAQDVFVRVNPDSLKAQVSRDLHGIFFEEISHGGEGGLYAEMIQNRGFEDFRVPPGCHVDSGFLIPPRTMHFSMQPQISDWKMPWTVHSDYPAWSLKREGKSKAEISITSEFPLTKATPHALKIKILTVDAGKRIAVINDGFWGISMVKGERYLLSFYIRTSEGFRSDVKASVEGKSGNVLAESVFKNVNCAGWKKMECTFTAKETDPNARFLLSFYGKGTVCIDFVSLFPEKTFKNRPNGMRNDLAQLLADFKPSFVRWPGGCYVEGVTIQSAPDWKKTIGPQENRPGTYSPWGYWSSDGFGYHEYLQFCEDIGAKALYVFNCGVSCDYRSGTFVPNDSLSPYIQNAIDAIEYALGSPSSGWGAVRAKNGHPAPFPLSFVEVGNEQVGKQYGERFNAFYKAIKSRFPDIKVIASMGISHVDKATLKAIDQLDIVDEHTYKSIYWPMVYHDWYDKYPRNKYDMYVGEFACNGGVGKGNMMAALNDAASAFMYERNSDLIKMTSYAPLLENVNTPHWDVNLIKFDNSKSYARISYYVLKMLNEHKADVNIETTVDIVPPKQAKPKYSGKIGLSTWDTYAEFKDVEVFKDGVKVYASDFKNKPDEWETKGGNWLCKEDALAQVNDGAWPLAILKGHTFDTYTLKLKARKTGGPNAFMIPIAIKDSSNYLRLHIGAWWNRVCAIEMVSNGADAMVSQPVTLEKPIEKGQWYDVEIRVENAEISCFLDGKLLLTYHDPSRFFCITGKDENKKEVVLKVINAYGVPMKANIDLGEKITVDPRGTLISVSAPTAESENSFTNPLQFINQTSTVDNLSSTFIYEFKPYSVNVLRLKMK